MLMRLIPVAVGVEAHHQARRVAAREDDFHDMERLRPALTHLQAAVAIPGRVDSDHVSGQIGIDDEGATPCHPRLHVRLR